MKQVICVILACLMCLGTFAGFAETSAEYAKGSAVYFGHYEQDGNEENGNESIEWMVLDTSGDKILLLSKYCLDAQMYHDDENVTENIEWSKTSLNAWLNSDFKNAAFTEAEQAAITPSDEVITDFEAYFKGGAIYTEEAVFLLDSAERKKYFPNEGDFYAYPTIALYNSGKVNGEWAEDGGYYVTWWLRGRGLAFNRPVMGYSVSNKSVNAIRPAVWLDLNLHKPSLQNEGNVIAAESAPAAEPTAAPTAEPTPEPAAEPTTAPTAEPTPEPTEAPTPEPTAEPTAAPTEAPTAEPTPEPAKEAEDVQQVAPGQIIEMGSYEQDGDSGNGTESIEWIVLETDGESAWLLSRYALDAVSYGKPMDVTGYTDPSLNWSSSYLRGWLNGEFIENAFAEEELAAILSTQVETDDASGVTETTDRIFCLSADEVKAFFADKEEMACMVTEYTESRLKKDAGAVTEQGYGIWWLRDLALSAAKSQTKVNEGAVVSQDYGVDYKMPAFCDYLAVARPSMKVSLSAIAPVEQAEEPAAEGPAAEAETVYEPLARGAKGDAVVALQERLNALYYSVGTADGDYGGKTQTAIETFQRINGLTKTGEADAQTQALLFSENAICNLENLPGVSIVDKLEDLIDSAPDISSSEHYSYEMSSIGNNYMEKFGIENPNDISINNWTLRISFANDKVYACFYDECKYVQITMKGKGKATEVTKVLKWEKDFVDMIPEILEWAEEAGCHVEATFEDYGGEDLQEYIQDGVLDLTDAVSWEALQDSVDAGYSMMETMAVLAEAFSGF